MGQVGILKRDEENASTATTLESKVDEAKRTEQVTGSVSPPLEMAQAWTHKAESARVSVGSDRVLVEFYVGTAFIKPLASHWHWPWKKKKIKRTIKSHKKIFPLVSIVPRRISSIRIGNFRPKLRGRTQFVCENIKN